MKHTPLSLPMTRDELFRGIGFLMVQQLMLSPLLGLLPGSAVLRNCLYAGISFAAGIGLFFRFLRKSVENFPKNIGFFLWQILLSYAGCMVIQQLFSQILYPICPNFYSLTNTGLALKTPNDRVMASLLEENLLLTALCAVVLLPPVEELIHRGVVFGGLYDKSPVAAYAVSAALFSAIHVMDYLGSAHPLWILLSFLEYLPAGLILARLYKQTDSIFAPILLHMVINAVSLFSMR